MYTPYTQYKDQLYLRNTLGICGMLLPILDALFNIVFGGSFNPSGVLTSISATHYSSAYILFEGLVFGVGLFLICYRGYDIKDFWISTVSGIGAILLVLFPCKLDAPVRNFMMLPMSVTNVIHLISAFIFFAGLIVIIAFQFTKTSKLRKSPNKQVRNVIYFICAGVMALSLILGFTLPFAYSTYIGESIALEAFGLAWIIKGGLILGDK